MSNFVTSQDGINLITAFEGCKLTGYLDSVGVPTVGYGHTGPEVTEGMVITQDQAITYLKADLKTAENAVNRYVTYSDFVQNEFDGLVSFTYNLGSGNLQRSTLLRDLNAGSVAAAADQFLVWDNAGFKLIRSTLLHLKLHSWHEKLTSFLVYVKSLISILTHDEDSKDLPMAAVLPGLLRRRKAERALFLGQDWTVFNNGVV